MNRTHDRAGLFGGPFRRLRVGAPSRVFSQVLLMQVVIARNRPVTALVTGLFLAPLSAELDDRATLRALTTAQTTALQPGLAELVADPAGPPA